MPAGGMGTGKQVETSAGEVAELLLPQGADVNGPDNDGDTPLHKAAYSGEREVAELLLAGKADVNAEESNLLSRPIFIGLTQRALPN